ncbi:MAG: NADH-quinone oxidoreductase subunit NuoE [Candidatus Eisenbacteria bacterium]|nr:NADH-quinone oxidoreductase subunit NuoE [Candidatus Eisenbacteria bacterium]
MGEHRRLDFKNLHYVGMAGILIPALQKAQAKDGYITREEIDRIHREHGIPLAQIYGVATFYSQFRLHPVGKHIIRVCHGTACHVSGANAITKGLEDHLEIQTGETTEDKFFTLETVSCLGCCSLAPVIMVDNNTHGNLKPEEMKKILKPYRKAAEEVAQS